MDKRSQAVVDHGLFERGERHCGKGNLFDSRVHDRWSFELLLMVQRIMNTVEKTSTGVTAVGQGVIPLYLSLIPPGFSGSTLPDIHPPGFSGSHIFDIEVTSFNVVLPCVIQHLIFTTHICIS